MKENDYARLIERVKAFKELCKIKKEFDRAGILSLIRYELSQRIYWHQYHGKKIINNINLLKEQERASELAILIMKECNYEHNVYKANELIKEYPSLKVLFCPGEINKRVLNLVTKDLSKSGYYKRVAKIRQAFNNFTYELSDNTRVKINEIRKELALTQNRDKRKELFKKLPNIKSLEELITDHLTKTNEFYKERLSHKEIKNKSDYDCALLGVNSSDLIKDCWVFERKTRTRAKNYVKNVIKFSGLNSEFAHWDWEFYNKKFLETELKGVSFPSINKIIKVFRKGLSMMGFNEFINVKRVGNPNYLLIDLEENPSKVGGCYTFEFPVSKKMALFINPASFPNNFVLNRALWHELGHAIHQLILNENERLYERSDSSAWCEGIAEFFGYIPLSNDYLKEFVKESEQELLGILESHNTLMDRKITELAVAELLMYEEDFKNPSMTYERVRKNFNLLPEPKGVDLSYSWLLHHHFWGYPGYRKNYFIAVNVRKTLVNVINKEFNGPLRKEVASFLVNECMKGGQRIHWKERLKKIKSY